MSSCPALPLFGEELALWCRGERGHLKPLCCLCSPEISPVNIWPDVLTRHDSIGLALYQYAQTFAEALSG